MLLLQALTALQPRHEWRLCVAHFHHQLRGADADADQVFVEAAARSRGLPFSAGTADVRGAVHRGESLEMAARRLRHAFLARVARVHGLTHVATGHHADDQVELVLIRLLRGAGPGGLAGMTVRGRSPADPELTIIRPLLDFPGQRLEAVARDLGLNWREDATNAEAGILRNRVRHELVPFLRRRFQPALGRVVARQAAVWRDQAEYLAAEAQAWLTGAAAARPFDDLPRCLQREVLRSQLESAGIRPDFDLIEVLRQFIDTPVQTKRRRRVVRRADGRIEVADGAATERPPFQFEELEVDLAGEAGGTEFGGVRVSWRRGRVGSEESPGRTGSGGEVVDADAVGTRVRLRHWRPGDRFRPIGLRGTAKLQDLFTNLRVPAAARRGRVLAETAAGEIFWVEGLRIGECAKRTPATRHWLVWQWSRSGTGG